MRHLPFAATLSLALASICMSSSASADAPTYSPRPVAAVTPGNYLLRLRVASVNGAPVQSRLVRAVPVVIGIRGVTLGVGGKYGPQITGSWVNGTLSASGPTPGNHGVLALTGGSGGAQGRFSVTRADGSSAGGEYFLDPVVPGILGQTLTGVGTTSGFTNMTPVPPGSAGGTTTGLGETPPQGTGQYGNGYTGPRAGQFGNGNTGSAPGMANEGPNLGGTPLSGWASEDPSPPSKINPKTAGGPNATSGAGTGPAPAPKQPGQYGDPKPAPTPPDGPGFGCTWLGLGCGSTPSGSAPAKPDGGNGGAKEDNPMNDGSHNAGTSGSGLNKPGGGNDTGGGSTSGGTNGANGATVNLGTRGGDNPFEVTPADVLNANHLVNFASDPVPGVGGAQTKATTH